MRTLIERPERRGKLKLRDRPTTCVSLPKTRTLPGAAVDRTHRCVSALPKCRPSGAAENAAMMRIAGLFRVDGRRGCGDDDHKSSSRSGCRSRLHGWIPMAVDRTSAPGAKNFPLPDFPRKRGPRPAFLAHAPPAPKFMAPAGAQRCACPPLASGGSGSVSSSRP
jgi:hypothetical protein